jgi:hypothetical protein
MSYVIAFAIGISILAVVIWAIRMLATPQPSEPDPDDVVAIAQDYRCAVCGLRLVVTHAQDEAVDAPRHCREDMVPTG